MLVTGTWHFILACMWLVLSVLILIVDPPNLRVAMFGNMSVGWFTLIFAAWSATRGWSLRSAYLRRRAAEEIQRHRPIHRHAEPETERNPDFMFDEKPEDQASGGA